MTRPTMPSRFPPAAFEAGVARPIDDTILAELRASGLDCDTDDAIRADHGRDWWPLSLHDVNRGVVAQWPGVVVRPRSTSEVATLMRLATKHRLAVTAQGGRSSVVGGAGAPDGAIALDLTGLERVVDLDTVAGTVTVEAGVFGPELESSLRAHGFTVGHFPQSFELSTVGGWLACRGAGQYSNRYGKIEDIVRGLTVVLASGDVLELGGNGPRQALGPDLVQLFVGSEGTLGIITEATLAMRPVAPYEARAAYGFATFSEGLEACRRVLQRGASPAVLRLYDSVESQRSFNSSVCTLIVLDEGDRALVDATMEVVAQECSRAQALDGELVATWLQHRNDVSALAPLWEQGIVVDTIEVAGPWSILQTLCDEVLGALGSLEATIVASVHQSHAYTDGACLYFTFAGRPHDDPALYYRAAWDVATRVVLDQRGAISHHHGIGRSRARFLPEALGSGFTLLQALKSTLDPLALLNPGVLALGGAPW